jgi:hypothetical protein
VAEWQRSGPEPGKDYSDISYETAGGVARDDPKASVIILTGADAATAGLKRADFAKFPRR